MNVLICPLNWGLGHATRLVPIIKLFIQYGYDIIIAGEGNSLNYLKKEFSNLNSIKLSGYNIKYSSRDSQVLKMLFKIPAILYCTFKEHYQLKRIIKKYNINIVISDNRFGLWNKRIFSIFITHQLNVKFPRKLKFFEFIYEFLLKNILIRYNECWIPDFQGENNLSGVLSHTKKNFNNTYFIGLLSRFEKYKKQPDTIQKKYDVLFLLSGPEPQRTRLENIIFNQTRNTCLKCVIVRGTDSKTQNSFLYPAYDILTTNKLIGLIRVSEVIICRAGYSSVMDLVTLQKKAILIPTPGQTEQEYLAHYLAEKNLFYSVKQKDFNFPTDIQKTYNFKKRFLKRDSNNNILIERILSLKEIQNGK